MNVSLKPLLLVSLWIGFYSCAFTQTEIKYDWPSANGWTGGQFEVPTWFAEDMKVSGHEVIHFHEGYYNSSNVGHWTYTFALIINELEEPSEAFLIDETRRYFVGLGRVLGDKKNPKLTLKSINVKATSKAFRSRYTGKVQNFELIAFDSWESAKSIKLNTRIYTWKCKGSKHRAIVYAISPQDWSHPIWDQLTAEVHSFSCQ